MNFSAQMAKELGLGSSEELKKHADALWKYLDDLAQRDPEAYRRFVAKQAEEAKVAQEKQADEISFMPKAGFVVSTVATKGNAELIAQIERKRKAMQEAAKSPLDLGLDDGDSTGTAAAAAGRGGGSSGSDEKKGGKSNRPGVPVVIETNAMLFLNLCHSPAVPAPLQQDGVTPASAAHPLSETIVPLSVGALRMEDVSVKQFPAVSKALVCDVAFSSVAMERVLRGDLQLKFLVVDLALRHVEKDFRCSLHRAYTLIDASDSRYLGTVRRQLTEEGLRRRREAKQKVEKLKKGFTKDDVVLPNLGAHQTQNLGGGKVDDTPLVRLPGSSEAPTGKKPLIVELPSPAEQARATPSFTIKTKAGEVIIAIDLPCEESAAELEVDLSATQLSLESNHYTLLVPLPCKVDDNQSHAKFNKKKRRLTISAPAL